MQFGQVPFRWGTSTISLLTSGESQACRDFKVNLLRMLFVMMLDMGRMLLTYLLYSDVTSSNGLPLLYAIIFYTVLTIIILGLVALPKAKVCFLKCILAFSAVGFILYTHQSVKMLCQAPMIPAIRIQHELCNPNKCLPNQEGGLAGMYQAHVATTQIMVDCLATARIGFETKPDYEVYHLSRDVTNPGFANGPLPQLDPGCRTLGLKWMVCHPIKPEVILGKEAIPEEELKNHEQSGLEHVWDILTRDSADIPLHGLVSTEFYNMSHMPRGFVVINTHDSINSMSFGRRPFNEVHLCRLNIPEMSTFVAKAEMTAAPYYLWLVLIVAAFAISQSILWAKVSDVAYKYHRELTVDASQLQNGADDRFGDVQMAHF